MWGGGDMPYKDIQQGDLLGQYVQPGCACDFTQYSIHGNQKMKNDSCLP